VRKGDQISQALADELLRAEILRIATDLHQIIPASAKWGGNQQAALISWAYNVGLGAVKDSTLRRRINAGEGGTTVIPQELPKWNKVNGNPLEGLTRRRAA
jgi:GH24 family phage-related lysozyme (muramidase)